MRGPRPGEGSIQIRKALRKAGLWVYRDHSGCLLARRLKERRAGCRVEGGGIRHGQVARTGGLAEPLSRGGAAPCFEKPV